MLGTIDIRIMTEKRLIAGGEGDLIPFSFKMLYTPSHAKQALDIVEACLPLVNSKAEYTELVEILRDQSRWKEAHSLFSRIRTNITLNFKNEDRSLDHYFAYIAENATKTAYNCSGESAPFDADSFAWLLSCEKQFTEKSAMPSGRSKTK